MSDTTKIQWAEHTGGPYFGCSCVSPGCAFCYAMALALSRLEPIFRRAYKLAGFADWATRPVWGDKATRVLSKGFWNDARRINAKHAKEGTRGRWFPSMIDWLDTMPAGIIDQDGKKLDPVQVRSDFLRLIFETKNLDWLLLTKRPENFRDLIEEVLILANGGDPKDKQWFAEHDGSFPAGEFADWLNEWTGENPPANVWIGASAEDQQRADERIPALAKIPAVVRFLSCEPLLEGIDIIRQTNPNCFDWVIVGGESGSGARPCNVEWIRNIMQQCKASKVPVFVKQLGARPYWNGTTHTLTAHSQYLEFKDKKGGDISEWPKDLQVREYPHL